MLTASSERIVVGRKKGVKLKGYLSVQETASKWGVSVCRVNQYVLAGRIPGCERFGHAWAIPEVAVKPDRLPSGAKAKPSPVDRESEGKV